ncbi:terpene synthase family protein [Nonomuraea sp. NPDC001684]
MPDPRLFGLADLEAGPFEAQRSLNVVAAADAATAALDTMGVLTGWAERHGPPFDPAVIPLCCLTAAICTPWLDADACLLLAGTAAWLLAVDAWSDAPRAVPHSADDSADDSVEAGVARCLAVVEGGDPEPGDALAASLADLRDRVTGPVAAWWRRAAVEHLRGTLFERRAADAVAAGGRAPGVEEYLRHARGSIGLAMQATAAWSAMDPEDVRAWLPALRQPLRDASTAVRLANDLRGHDRERAEGTVDALTLGLSQAEVAERLARHVARCRAGLRPLAGTPAAVALDRIMTWGIRMYQLADAGHTWKEEHA